MSCGGSEGNLFCVKRLCCVIHYHMLLTGLIKRPLQEGSLLDTPDKQEFPDEMRVDHKS